MRQSISVANNDYCSLFCGCGTDFKNGWDFSILAPDYEAVHQNGSLAKSGVAKGSGFLDNKSSRLHALSFSAPPPNLYEQWGAARSSFIAWMAHNLLPFFHPSPAYGLI